MARRALALVAPLSGLFGFGLAAAAHATPPLAAPWPCDVAYEITQGHNTGSHVDEGAWAWDVGIGVGQEVAAPADGVVRRIRVDSTSYGCSSAYANDANYVVLDFGDGTEALFLHLEAGSSGLAEGDAVARGDVVGRVGLSGWVCGAHLHFQIQATCDSWWCQSIPAEIEGVGDPGLGATVVSDNCGPPCSASVGPGETTIDERTRCFSRQTSYWWSVDEGHEGHHFYTFGTDADADDTIGRWTFEVASAGRYRVEAHVPETEADSTSARYRIDGGGGVQPLATLDQSTQKGWVSLGEVDLLAGPDRYVELGDATGEAYDQRRKLAYDAIRFVSLDDEPSGSSSATGPTGTTGGGAGTGDGGSAEGDGGRGAGGDGDGDGGGGATEPRGGDGGSASTGEGPATTSDPATGCGVGTTSGAVSKGPFRLLAIGVMMAWLAARGGRRVTTSPLGAARRA